MELQSIIQIFTPVWSKNNVMLYVKNLITIMYRAGFCCVLVILTLIQPLQCSSVWDKFGTAYYASPNLKGRQRLLSYKKLEYYQFTPSVDRMSTHRFVWHKKFDVIWGRFRKELLHANIKCWIILTEIWYLNFWNIKTE